MREVSIISIIRKYGLESKRISHDYHVKYDDALKLLSECKNSRLSIINAVDNAREPAKSMSHKCQISSCGKRIRYEYWVKDSKSNKTISVGMNCACALLGLSKIQANKLKTVDQLLRDKAELEEWKTSNKDVYDKLQLIEKLNLDHFKPFCNEIKYAALNKEDTDYIRKVNYKLVLINVKYMNILKELMQYDSKNTFYKSVYNNIAYNCHYISTKQKDAINRAYENYLKEKDKIVIEVDNGYNFKDKLKENEYKFNPKSKKWIKHINITKKDNEINKLISLGIGRGDINDVKHK